MSFQTEATVLGCPVKYKLNPLAKRYTLRDNGFTETSSGNFQLIRPVEATPQSNQGFKLKITVEKDIKQFKMSITTANGMKAVNIFEGNNHEMNQEKFYFMMDGFISRGLFEKVE